MRYIGVFPTWRPMEADGKCWTFLGNLRTIGGMEKAEHGSKLAAAMASRRFDRRVVADATGRDVRTVTNWTTGKTMPSAAERAALRVLLGDYDAPGDPVETAVRSSRLTEDRQYVVLGVYKRELREQDEAEERRRGA